MDRRHARGEIAHDLPSDTVGILRGLREGDTILEAGDHVVAPVASMLIGEFIRLSGSWVPRVASGRGSILQRKLETARHDADDRVRPAVENDGTSEDWGSRW